MKNITSVLSLRGVSLRLQNIHLLISLNVILFENAKDYDIALYTF